jgi:hypothetical protein
MGFLTMNNQISWKKTGFPWFFVAWFYIKHGGQKRDLHLLIYSSTIGITVRDL